ncbi:MAG TPA: LPP20 family lipoprotein [bacterium]|nr:LPP20 family lipoprotein [bacterium]
MLSKIYRAIILLTVLSAVVFAKVPDWVTGEHYKFPSQQYFTGVGIAETRDQAVERARADLIKQIKVTIESELTTEEREEATGKTREVSSSVVSKTKSSVDATVAGIEIGDLEESDNKFYALAVLNKNNYFQSIRSEIDRILEESDNLLTAARKNVKDGQILNAFENFKKASALVEDYAPKNELLVSLTGMNYREEEVISSPQVITEMRNIITKLDLEMLSGNSQTAASGQYLPEDVKIKVVYNGDSGLVGVNNFPVLARYKNGDPIEEKRTQSDGSVGFRIKAVATGMTGNNGSVEIQLAPDILPAEMRDMLSRSKVEVNYKIETPDLKFALTNQGQSEYAALTGKIKNIVTSSGFEIDSQAPFLIKIDHEIVNEREISSPFGTQYLVEVDVNFNLLNKKSGDVLSSYSIQGKGLSKKSKSDARNIALQRIRIKRDEFVSFLNKAS